MSYENEYLSDEELNALIREIERNDLVMAPPDIMEKVLTQTKNKKRDFTMYCFRVAASAAAAIVMLFTLPGVLQNMSPKISDVVTDAYQKEMYETVEYINKFPVKGIKFQLLHILSGTDLYEY